MVAIQLVRTGSSIPVPKFREQLTDPVSVKFKVHQWADPPGNQIMVNLQNLQHTKLSNDPQTHAE